jgi:hypothetical protein
MNLQENIQRIQEVMGVNTSNIQTMIDTIGMESTIKFFGGYDAIKDIYGNELFNKDNKIKFIKAYLNKHKHYLRYGNLFTDYDERPIHVYEDKKVIKQIESLDEEGAFVDVYGKPHDAWIEGYNVPYEELPNDILDEIFGFIVHISEDE